MMENEYTDILHNGALEGLDNYKVFRRRYPLRTSLPTRAITDWYIQEIQAPGKAFNKWICLCGIYKDTIIRTSPITSILSSKRICTYNCIYVLESSSKVLQNPFFGIESKFIEGFPSDWEKIVEKAIIECNNIGSIDMGNVNIEVNANIKVEKSNIDISKGNIEVNANIDINKNDIIDNKIDNNIEIINNDIIDNDMCNKDIINNDIVDNDINNIDINDIDINNKLELINNNCSLNLDKYGAQFNDDKTIQNINNIFKPTVKPVDPELEKEFNNYDESLLEEDTKIRIREPRNNLKDSKYSTVEDFIQKTSPFKAPKTSLKSKAEKSFQESVIGSQDSSFEQSINSYLKESVNNIADSKINNSQVNNGEVSFVNDKRNISNINERLNNINDINQSNILNKSIINERLNNINEVNQSSIANKSIMNEFNQSNISNKSIINEFNQSNIANRSNLHISDKSVYTDSILNQSKIDNSRVCVSDQSYRNTSVDQSMIDNIKSFLSDQSKIHDKKSQIGNLSANNIDVSDNPVVNNISQKLIAELNKSSLANLSMMSVGNQPISNITKMSDKRESIANINKILSNNQSTDDISIPKKETIDNLSKILSNNQSTDNISIPKRESVPTTTKNDSIANISKIADINQSVENVNVPKRESIANISKISDKNDSIANMTKRESIANMNDSIANISKIADKNDSIANQSIRNSNINEDNLNKIQELDLFLKSDKSVPFSSKNSFVSTNSPIQTNDNGQEKFYEEYFDKVKSFYSEQTLSRHSIDSVNTMDSLLESNNSVVITNSKEEDNIKNMSHTSIKKVGNKRPSIKIPSRQSVKKTDESISRTIENASILEDLDSENNEIKTFNIVDEPVSISNQSIKRTKKNSYVEDSTAIDEIGKDTVISENNLSYKKEVVPLKIVSSIENESKYADRSINKSVVKNKKKKNLLIMPKKLKNISKKPSKK